MTKEELKELSDQTFPDNESGAISPENHRGFNNEIIDFIPKTTYDIESDFYGGSTLDESLNYLYSDIRGAWWKADGAMDAAYLGCMQLDYSATGYIDLEDNTWGVNGFFTHAPNVEIHTAWGRKWAIIYGKADPKIYDLDGNLWGSKIRKAPDYDQQAPTAVDDCTIYTFVAMDDPDWNTFIMVERKCYSADGKQKDVSSSFDGGWIWNNKAPTAEQFAAFEAAVAANKYLGFPCYAEKNPASPYAFYRLFYGVYVPSFFAEPVYEGGTRTIGRFANGNYYNSAEYQQFFKLTPME